LAGFLEGHPAVSRVIYPGFPSHPQYALAEAQMKDAGTVVSFDLAGGKEAAFGLLNGLEIIDISNNLGDTKSLITHPATTTHRAMGPEARARIGVGDGMVRLSAGLEDLDDLKEELQRALDGAAQRLAG
jgi:O-succinylhomoserine sulfhydrylase